MAGKSFEELYQGQAKVREQLDEIEKQYKKAADAGDGAAMGYAKELYARAKSKADLSEIKALPKPVQDLYYVYADSRRRGNRYLDFNGTMDEKGIPEKLETLRAYGARAFTFSSGWSSAVETAWLFVQNGCTLQGMAEIYGPGTDFDGNREKIHGYLFSL